MRKRFEIPGEHHHDRLCRIARGDSLWGTDMRGEVKWNFVADNAAEYKMPRRGSRWTEFEFPVSLLEEHTCQRCGRRGKKNNITHSWAFADPAAYTKNWSKENIIFRYACFGCRMVLKKQRNEYQECVSLITQIKKARKKLYEISKNNVADARSTG